MFRPDHVLCFMNNCCCLPLKCFLTLWNLTRGHRLRKEEFKSELKSRSYWACCVGCRLSACRLCVSTQHVTHVWTRLNVFPEKQGGTLNDLIHHEKETSLTVPVPNPSLIYLTTVPEWSPLTQQSKSNISCPKLPAISICFCPNVFKVALIHIVVHGDLLQVMHYNITQNVSLIEVLSDSVVSL